VYLRGNLEFEEIQAIGRSGPDVAGDKAQGEDGGGPLHLGANAIGVSDGKKTNLLCRCLR
jgi:hypothetical protein